MERVDPHHSNLLKQPPHHMSHWSLKVFHSLEKILPVKLLASFDEPLAKYHIDWYVRESLRHLFSINGYKATRLLFNRYTLKPIALLLGAGPHCLILGHSLLVVLRKMLTNDVNLCPETCLG
jgi:hypothetical protein